MTLASGLMPKSSQAAKREDVVAFPRLCLAECDRQMFPLFDEFVPGETLEPAIWISNQDCVLIDHEHGHEMAAEPEVAYFRHRRHRQIVKRLKVSPCAMHRAPFGCTKFSRHGCREVAAIGADERS